MRKSTRRRRCRRPARLDRDLNNRPFDTLRLSPLNTIDTLGLDHATVAALRLRCLRSARKTVSTLTALDLPAAGYFHPGLKSQFQVCGSAAELWLDSAEEASAAAAALQAHAGTALLLAADGSACPRLSKLAIQHFDGAILTTPLCESRATAVLRSWAAMQAQVQIVHGVLMQIHGLGLLLTGASGVGKSGLALELLSRGHRLVADDAVEVRSLGHGCLIGSSPALLNGSIETRGLGILDARSLFGASAVVQRSRIDLVVELQAPNDSPVAATAEQRIEGCRGSHALLGQTLPMISLSPRLGHNLAVVTEVGCRDHWLRLSGYHADVHFIERQQRQIEDA